MRLQFEKGHAAAKLTNPSGKESLLLQARNSWFDVAIDQSRNFLSHYPKLHPAKGRLEKCLTELRAVDGKLFDQVKQDALHRLASCKDKLPQGALDKISAFVFNLFHAEPDTFATLLLGALKLGVAKFGDPIRYNPVGAPDLKYECAEFLEMCTGNAADTTRIQALMHKFAHDVTRLPGISATKLPDAMYVALTCFFAFLGNVYDPEKVKVRHGTKVRGDAHTHHHGQCGCNAGGLANAVQRQLEDDVHWAVTAGRCAECDYVPQGGKKGLLKCSACKKIYYCSVQCQRKHWKTHKEECQK